MNARLLLIPLSLLFSCATPGREPASDSVGFPLADWGEAGVRVCFGRPENLRLTSMAEEFGDDREESPYVAPAFLTDWPAREREVVREAVTREYTAARTGIEFTGWNECDAAASGADLVLLLASGKAKSFGYSGYASIGRSLDVDHWPIAPFKGKKAYVYLKSPAAWSDGLFPRLIDQDDKLAITALHEFGHVAGLTHEHRRLHRRVSDPLCKWTMAGYAEDRARFEEPDYSMTGEKAYGRYDPYSIMSYCFMDAVETMLGREFTIDLRLPAYRQGPLRQRKTGEVEIAADGTRHDIAEIAPDRPTPQGGALPSNAISPAEPSLFVAERLDAQRTRYRVKIGLSLGDVHAIRCIQGAYSETEARSKCRPEFDPVRAYRAAETR